MAEPREPFSTRDENYDIPLGGPRDVGSQPQQAAAEQAAKERAAATPEVPRGPNTPENLEQILDLSDVPTETGIHMHPASLILPDEEQELDVTEGDDSTLP